MAASGFRVRPTYLQAGPSWGEGGHERYWKRQIGITGFRRRNFVNQREFAPRLSRWSMRFDLLVFAAVICSSWVNKRHGT